MQLDDDQGVTPGVEISLEDKPKSMDDTIRDTLRSLQSPEDSTIAPPAPAPAPAPAPEAPEQVAQRIRDGQGKFAGKPPDGALPGDGADQARLDQAATVDQVKPAPNTWKKEAAEAWIKADPVIRAEVERREQDFFKGIEQYKSAAGFGQSIERAIAPYAQTLQQLGVAPERAIGELMAADHKLRHGTPQEKTTYFAQLAHSYGIDIGQAAQQHQSIDPSVFALQSQVQQLQGQIQNHNQAAQQQSQDTLNSEIQVFASNPSHSHFDAVRGHMSALLQAGQAKDLDDAYEQAIYANPTTRAAVLQQQATAQRDETAKKAQAAKAAASVNVRARAAMPAALPTGTMDDTIRQTLRKLQGG